MFRKETILLRKVGEWKRSPPCSVRIVPTAFLHIQLLEVVLEGYCSE